MFRHERRGVWWADMSEDHIGEVITTDSGWTILTLKQYLENAMAQADQRYMAKFQASETAVNTALAASEKAVNAAFASSEKATSAAFAASEKAVAAAFAASDRAIIKAEEAQKIYNAGTNEFRGQLKDQADTFAARTEVDARFTATEATIKTQQLSFEDKLFAQQKSFEDKLAALQTANEKRMDSSADDIKSLRESRSAGDGAQVSRHDTRITQGQVIGYIFGAAGVIFAAIALYMNATGK